ncbi:MAG TPA: ATP-dependent helicase [Patescibacteria group bacterium]|nr:ATP-dependent helicase [Patescibacteria group bacterium]
MQQYTIKNIQPTSDFKIDYKSELNDEQYRAVVGAEGPCLVLAGAGSGKTRTLVYRVAYLLERGVKPNRILLVTFTNKAAREMMSRIELILKFKPKGLWGGTFHHIGNRCLRMYGKHIGIDSNFNILDAEDAKALVKSCLSSIAVPKDKSFPKADLIYKIISLSINLSQPVAEVICERFSQINEKYIDLIMSVADNYQTKKKKANSLDFDDLLSEWNRLLLESQEIREKLAKRFKYILVDEYQDTNHIQGEIVAHLAGQDQNVLVVGDDSQSIYSFRGADVSNILDFPKIYPKSQTFKLETNYRSTPEILRLANQSITYNSNQFKKELHTNKKPGIIPVLAPLEDSRQQANFVCQRILDLARDEGVELSGMAILFRAHFQSLEMELELNKRNIPYVMRGGLRFFEQAHIKDVISYLKVTANFHDEVSWQRILLLQAGIGQVNASSIWRKISGAQDIKEVVRMSSAGLSAKAEYGFGQARNILKKLLVIDKNDISAMIDAVLGSGYREYLKSKFENYQDRIDDLTQLALFAENYESREKFLTDTALGESFKGDKIADHKDRSEEAVVLSTIHQAKGLEWKAVFVIGLVDGQFPNARAYDIATGMEEERRLFYVAVTRAQDQLYLTYPMFSLNSGNINQMSQFIKELPDDAYEPWQISEQDTENVIYVDEDGESVSENFWQRMANRRNQDN